MTRLPLGQIATSLPPPRGRRRARAPLPTRACIAVAAVLALAALAAPAAATVYKWVDANGRVVYSDQPPPASVKSEVVKPPPPPANPNAAKELEDRELAARQREKKRAEEAKAADTARQTSERRREACVTALGQIRALQQKDEPVVRFNDKGERVVYSDDMRRDEFERLQQIVRENCPG